MVKLLPVLRRAFTLAAVYGHIDEVHHFLASIPDVRFELRTPTMALFWLEQIIPGYVVSK